MDWHFYNETTDALEKLRQDGYLLTAIEQVEGSIPLNEFSPDLNAKYAIILGNEVKGVSQKAVNMCDLCIEIPQFGTKHSFNVSVSAGIVLWELSRRWILD